MFKMLPDLAILSLKVMVVVVVVVVVVVIILVLEVIVINIPGKTSMYIGIGMRLLCRNNFGNNRMKKELRIIPE